MNIPIWTILINLFPWKKAYSFDPIPEGLEEKLHIRSLEVDVKCGGNGFLTLLTMDKMVFPRLAAYAEVGWTSKTRKDYPVFVPT